MTADMQQINLLPDIKQERIKQQKREQLIRMVAIIVIAATGAIALIAVSATYIYQRGLLISTQEDIEEERVAIAAMDSQDELTGMQKALEELPQLSQERILVSQLPEILESVVPSNVSVVFFEYIDEGSNIEIVAESSSYIALYEFVDALERVEGEIVDEEGAGRETEFFTNVEFIASSHGEEITFSIEGSLDDTFLTPVDILGQNGGSDE